ncbi:hypothetical protein EDC04DRAFT_2618319 [Pisolithus marmoratus]|nr:hypothetical protein EDC04DRAFT_2618319 [Pisolithus marmoratus]
MEKMMSPQLLCLVQGLLCPCPQLHPHPIEGLFSLHLREVLLPWCHVEVLLSQCLVGVSGAPSRLQSYSVASMMVHATPPTAAHEEESQLPDFHYFLHTPASDDGFPSQSIQCLQGSGSIDVIVDEVSPDEEDRAAESLVQNNWQQEQQSQTPLTSHWHGTPLIDPALLAEDAHFKIDILNIYIMFINSSSLIAQLHSNKMCCWMNIHLQPLPNKFQLLCGAASDPFPSRAWFVNEKSALYITEVMAECEQMGMLIPCGYWPDYHKDLGILLWEALMMWQSTLEAKAHEYVGTMCNMASPALAGLIIDFFYATPSALGNLFLEVFAQEVPKPVVCLAVTALQAAIDDTHSKVFVQLMAMQTKIDGNHKHAAMTQMLRIGWATTGSALLGRKMTTPSEDDFEVVLD